ncbi:AAA family ATPase [Paraburkholderia tropica]|uniref:AAA family ATPase n=1 Tax=Paraburkholderia tropica TaxID=92647 RepID=UPI002AB0FBE8|nr:AAA family ATPase [Paraburkholderia tropica]
MPVTFPATTEQLAAVEAALQGGNLKIKAGAGAGKTSTVQLLADGFGQRRGIYLAFNRDIAAAAARKFPAHVPARTMHAHAWAAADGALRRRGSLDAEPPHLLASRFGIGAVQVRSVTGRAVELVPFETGRIIADALGRFCRSADLQPEASHIVMDEKIDEWDAAQLRHWLLPFVRRLWDESAAPGAHGAVSPDVVLKLWALLEPRIEADYILFDEAQDSDAVMLSVLARQRHAQVVYVGDPYQQNEMSASLRPQCQIT